MGAERLPAVGCLSLRDKVVKGVSPCKRSAGESEWAVCAQRKKPLSVTDRT
jgi:hypothetical protein